MKYRLLLIHPSRINKAKEKGVLNSFNIFLEDDLFDHLYAFSFLGKDKLKYSLSQSISLIDDGWQFLYDKLPNLVSKPSGTLLLLGRLIFIWPIFFFKIKPNIIRSTDPQYSGLYSYFISFLLQLPLVISIHSNYDECYKTGGFSFSILGSRKLAKMLEKFVLNRAHHIICISHYLKDWIHTEYLIPVSKITVAHHAYFGLTYKREFTSRNHESFYNISVVSRLSLEKHSLDLLILAQMIRESGLPYKISVAGDGPLMSKMKDYVNDQGLSEILVLRGFLSSCEVCKLRKEAFLHVSLLDGMSLVEAAAFSQLVLAYDNEWHSELIHDNITGYCVKSRDVVALFNKLTAISFSDCNTLNIITSNLYNLSLKCHSPCITTSLRAAVYHSLLKR